MLVELDHLKFWLAQVHVNVIFESYGEAIEECIKMSKRTIWMSDVISSPPSICIEDSFHCISTKVLGFSANCLLCSRCQICCSAKADLVKAAIAHIQSKLRKVVDYCSQYSERMFGSGSNTCVVISLDAICVIHGKFRITISCIISRSSIHIQTLVT